MIYHNSTIQNIWKSFSLKDIQNIRKATFSLIQRIPLSDNLMIEIYSHDYGKQYSATLSDPSGEIKMISGSKEIVDDIVKNWVENPSAITSL